MNEHDDQDIFAPDSTRTYCSIHGCGGPAAVRLYGSGIFEGGELFCGPHGVEYERRGFGRTLEEFWEKHNTREARREEERRRGYGGQLQIGRAR